MRAFLLCKGGERVSWSEQTDRELLDLVSEHGTKWRKLSEMFSVNKSPSALKLRWQNYLCENPKRRRPDYSEIQEPSNPIQKAIQHRKHQFNRDGSQTSERLIPESALQTPETLIQAFDYNPDMFELVNSTANYWDSNAGEGNVITLYQAKVTVKPKKQGLDIDDLASRIQSLAKPFSVECEAEDITDRHLIIPLYDLHFGMNTAEDYQESQDEILSNLEFNYKSVLIVMGGDTMHADNFNSTTTRGTQLETVSIPDAWEQAGLYIEPIIQKALKTSPSVKFAYLKGNHAETVDWAFSKYIEAKYTQLECDTTVKERKAYLIGNNGILLHHGDKQSKTKSLTDLFASEYPHIWAAAKHREVLTGHKHFEQVVNTGGLVHRQVPTRAKTDNWHADNGYTTANKTFHLYEYADDGIKGVHYV